jgi:hypothetical protein
MVRGASGRGLRSAWWNRAVRGVELLELDRHTDARGSLLAFGDGSQIPFEVQNVYFILDCPDDALRAGHATANHSLIVPLSPSVTVEVDNGSERGSHRLTDPATGLLVRAGVWLRLSEFGEGTRLVVLSSKPYDEMSHFDAPQPALLEEVGP